MFKSDLRRNWGVEKISGIQRRWVYDSDRIWQHLATEGKCWWNRIVPKKCLWSLYPKSVCVPFSVQCILPQDVRCKPLSCLTLSQRCSYVICLHVMRPLCPIEEIVQMDQISSRLTHRHPTHGVGGLLSLSLCAWASSYFNWTFLFHLSVR